MYLCTLTFDSCCSRQTEAAVQCTIRLMSEGRILSRARVCNHAIEIFIFDLEIMTLEIANLETTIWKFNLGNQKLEI